MLFIVDAKKAAHQAGVRVCKTLLRVLSSVSVQGVKM